MNTVIWVLVIIIPSGYCMSSPEIKFRTEKECVTALNGLDQHTKQTSKCVPRKEGGE